MARLNNVLNGNVNLGKLQQPKQGPSDLAERNRLSHVRIVGGSPYNQNSYIIGYNRPQWMSKLYALFHSNYDEVNKPYDAQLDAISRQYPGPGGWTYPELSSDGKKLLTKPWPKVNEVMGPQSWVDSINQVNIPRNTFRWHPVPELANLPVAGGSPGQVQQQYIMIEPSEQLVAGLLSARRMVPRTQQPIAYGQPLVTMSDSGIVVNQIVKTTPGLYQNLEAQAQSGNNFFTWLVQKIRGGQ